MKQPFYTGKECFEVHKFSVRKNNSLKKVRENNTFIFKNAPYYFYI